MASVDTKKALEKFDANLDMTIGPLELYEMIKSNEDINVIDVRESFDFAVGHIPGALNLPRISWTSTFGLTNDKLNIIYCYSEVCHLAADAAKYFAEHDFHVMELEGGFKEWKGYGLPVVK